MTHRMAAGGRTPAAGRKGRTLWLHNHSKGRTMTTEDRPRTRGGARAAVLARTGGTCYTCGRQLDPAAFDVDHVRALADGGAHVLGNKAPACPACNRSRGARRHADPDPRTLARALAARLAALGLRGAMLPPRVGPAAVVLDVRPAAGYVRPMLAAAAELRAALGRPCRVFQHGAAVRVEVARWTRPGVTLADLPTPAGLAIPLGLDAATGAPLGLDLGAAAHVLIAGQTGSGKSTVLRTLAAGLARAGARLALADSDADTWGAFQGAAALAYAIAQTPAAARALVLTVAGELGRGRGGPALVLIVDEVQTLDAAGIRALGDVLARGRKHGLHVVLATQYVRADVLDRRLTDQAGWRIAGRVTDATASRLILGCGGAETLTGAGDMLIARGGATPRRMLAAMPTAAELAELPRADKPAPALVDPDPDGGPDLDPDVLTWAIDAGPSVSARAIRMRWRIGQDHARLYRDAARAALTDSALTDRAGVV